MKKTTLIFIITILILTTNTAYADILEPGVANETQYKEVVFLSGQPVELSGTIKITQSGTGATKKITYDYNLAGENGSRLTRKAIFLMDQQTDENLKQIATGLILDPKAKITETITIEGKNYVLEDYIFNKAAITEDKSIIKYTSGTWNGRKIYNEGDNQIIVNIYGESYKYDNEWSTVETAIIRHILTYNFPQTTSTSIQQSTGTVEYGITNIREKEIASQQSLPNQISFKESYLTIEKEENTVSYKYDMPVITGTRTTRRKDGEGSFKLTTMPKLYPLPIPQYTDITGYWAEQDINRLFSLGVMDGDSKYFNPRTLITRAEFARALVKACGLEEDTTIKKPRSRKEVQDDIIFSDVDPTHPNYSYIKKVLELGIMNGTGYNTFSPEEPITKAQAVTIIIRALGLEDIKISNMGKTFTDEDQIPNWARKSIYVAEDLRILKLSDYNMIEPNKNMTRGEAANLINRLITYLQKEIKTDYRERVVNF
jgi:hypothetical protein